MYRQYLKHIIDFLFALLALLVISPVFFIVWLLLFVSNQGQAFFIQPRPGKDGKVFKIIKFRTMNNRRSGGVLLPDEQRLTPIGKIIRKTSLDEIPQLINVLVGDMSLIGPRPLLVQYLPLYNEHQKRRHDVRPGITGWAQINGRNAISWEKKFDMDVWYVDNLSFSMDMKILFMTVKKVIVSEGINSADAATMEPFNGN